MKKYFYLIIYFFPAVLALFFEIIFQEFSISRVYNLIENLIFYTLILLILGLFRSSKTKEILLLLAYIILGIFVWFESVFYYLYSVNFNASAVYILFETNQIETSEYIAAYLDKIIVSFSLLISVTILFCYIKTKETVNDYNFLPKFSTTRRLGSFFGILLVSLVFLKLTKLIIYNVPYRLIKATVQYQQETKKFDHFKLNTQNGSFTNVQRNQIAEEETYIFVIGESTTKNKMSLYGYEKDTNPRLNKIKNELFVFQNVISPHTATIESLTKTLTLLNYENEVDTSNGSIIQLMNAAGFKTYWISNQRPVGFHENLITKISSAADYSTFINIAIDTDTTPFDEELIIPFQKILNDSISKKAIFIHLAGTHVSYDKRYPKEFNHFKNNNSAKEQIIAQYDNAVLYNDFILREIIEKIRVKNIASCVLYFSDHGEEVYQDNDFFGHSEDNPTKPMYEIPFLLWTSPKYQERKNLKLDLSYPYMNDDLIHSISDLINISFDRFEKRRSIFNSEFTERPRVIQKNKKFEKIFNNKQNN
ncbi:sulfatase-like hydrolase/transferase [Aquimarina sp. 2201CG14-23]|uniref:sulfatase-like hydrolase/transferase n=1 Tax=Aquimarina mycalae TaxID=3040073 RepID=UPI002477DF27|nr:sulfatase-like hydrolase/transferase [Aquimarina sp. 2201CG14-23]MDH7447494.1 sulfatase-like hydrolase/transferase [Aquimarina sp. 2201CG14-23]